MENEHENTIRERAFALWQEAGCPDGHNEDFWDQAKAELDGKGDPLKAENLTTSINKDE